MKPAPGTSKASAGQVHSKFTQALALHQSGQLAQAKSLYQQVLQAQPRHADTLHLLGMLARQSGKLVQALELIGKSIEIQPNNFAAYSNLGNALSDLKRYPEAIASYDRAIALQPNHAEAYSNRGFTFAALKQYKEAVESYERATALKPDFVQAWCNLGNALLELKRYPQAIASYDRAIALKPDHADAWCNRGNALHALQEHAAAMASYQRAIAVQADHADAYCNCGNTLRVLKQQQEAIKYYDKAIALKPDHAEAYSNRGTALNDLLQHEQAIASYDQAIALRPDFAKAYSNRGNAFNGLKQRLQAIENYEKALALQQDHAYLPGTLLNTRMHVCDWQDADARIAELLTKIELGEQVAPSFPVLSLTSSPALQRKAAEIWVNDKHGGKYEVAVMPKRAKRQKIRIGYFSMDFREHPVAFLTAELFETHDRDRFEVYAFSYGLDTHDEMRIRLEAAFDQFIDVRSKSERDIANLARQLEIDIAIDLAGFTGSSRSGLFAWRAAPVQVSYLGYPGTMGAHYIDYLIADRQLIPEQAQAHYAEKIVYLPSFQVNDSKRSIANKVFTREELGLPQCGFVFCCFNNSYKISPSTFDGWMRILKQVDASVLMLFADNEVTRGNLRREASRRGVSANRFAFCKKLPLPEHLARYRTTDLFLDTLPYNAGTTASDALWAGVPVLTCTGEAFASRMASSLLTAIELPELITTSQADYEALAIELATNPERFQAIKNKLERNRLTTPLFDTQLFTRHIEDAYTQMYEKYHADLPPDHISVPFIP